MKNTINLGTKNFDESLAIINFGNCHVCSENHCSLLHTQGLKRMTSITFIQLISITIKHEENMLRCMQKHISLHKISQYEVS